MSRRVLVIQGNSDKFCFQTGQGKSLNKKKGADNFTWGLEKIAKMLYGAKPLL